MKQKARVATRRPRPARPPVLTIRLNPKELSEDELEYLYYLQHRHERRYPMDQVMHEAGYAVER